jgi:hypothetical protein
VWEGGCISRVCREGGQRALAEAGCAFQGWRVMRCLCYTCRTSCQLNQW